MTNKEAVDIIKYGLIDEKLFLPRVLGVEALELAIKALEFIDENYPKTFDDYLKGEEE